MVITSSGSYEARYVINAGGAFSAQVYELVGGHGLKQTNFCGQYYVLDKSQGGIINSVVFPCPDEHGFKGILVAPTVHGNLIVGPDAYQVEDGDHVATVEPYLSQVKSGGLRSVPGIDFRQTIHEYAGVRPNIQAMNLLKKVRLSAPVAAGAVVVQDICGTGVDWITTKNM